MSRIHLKGPGLNDWFAEMLVSEHGPVKALNLTCGPARLSVERVIASRQLEVDRSQVEPEPGRNPAPIADEAMAGEQEID